MSSPKFRPATRLETITRTFAVAEVPTILDALGQTFRPDHVEVTSHVEEDDVHVVAHGYVVDEYGARSTRSNVTWWKVGSGRSVIPELSEKMPLSSAPLWVRELVDEIR